MIWLIDLDNTLHNASHAIFPAIHVQMNEYMKTLLNETDESKINALRLLYLEKYGATLLGLVNHHQVNVPHFLEQTHRLDNLSTMMRYELGLNRLFKRLPGRKILLTNGPRHYAKRVVKRLGLHHHFEQQISIEAMRVHGRLRPKPSRSLLKKIMVRQKCRAHQCVLVEDTLSNLRSAKQVGMKTVWVTRYANLNVGRRAHFVDLKVRSVKHIPAKLAKLS